MAAYVIMDGVRKVCRAKDPAHCRYHKNADGSPLTHYTTRAEADAELERQHASGSEPTSLSKVVKTKTAVNSSANVDSLAGVDATSWEVAAVDAKMTDSQIREADSALSDLDATRIEADAEIQKLSIERAKRDSEWNAAQADIRRAIADVDAVLESPDVKNRREELAREISEAEADEAKLSPVERMQAAIDAQAADDGIRCEPIDLVSDEKYAQAMYDNELSRIAYSRYYSSGDQPAIAKESKMTRVEQYDWKGEPRLKVYFKNYGKTGRLGKERWFSFPADMASWTHARMADERELLAALESDPKIAASTSESTQEAYDSAVARLSDAKIRSDAAQHAGWTASVRQNDLQTAVDNAGAAETELRNAMEISEAIPSSLPMVPESEQRAFAANPGEETPDTAANRLNDQYKSLVGDADWHAYDPDSGWARTTSHSDRWYEHADFTWPRTGGARDYKTDELVNVKTGESHKLDKTDAATKIDVLKGRIARLKQLMAV